MGKLNRELKLNVLSEQETQDIRESHLDKSMSGMKSAIRDLNVKVTGRDNSVTPAEPVPHYEPGELADVARAVYRENINPKKEKAEYQDKGPDTHARRVERHAISRAIMGLRNGGDEGKTSYVGPNGSGNVGKYAPTAANGGGNATNNYDNYYALTTDMTLEEYEAHINTKMDEAILTTLGAVVGDAAAGVGNAVGGVAKGIGSAAKGAIKGTKKAVKGVTEPADEEEKLREDAVMDLKLILMQMEDHSWQEIDKVMRQVAKDNFMTPKELHKEFKAQHNGQIPDEWIKENRDIEMAGFIPLQELARLNPVGKIYNVSYMYRGGTQRHKFLVPHEEMPDKEEMEQYVRGFWPFARVLAYYPDPIDNEQNNNFMVAVPPVTENYKFYTPQDWVTLSEEELDIYDVICEEEGEPITAPEQQDDGTYLILVADHDTGEPKYISFGEGKKEEDRKDAMPKGDVGHDIHKRAVAQYNKQNPSKKVEESYDDPGDERKITRQGAERQNAVAKLMQDKEMQKKMDDAIAKSVARDKERGRVPGLPEPFKLKKREDQKEEFELEEESDKKGKGSGKKDACYSKVKSRYSVWPSAYASGALVKCRQKGAKNWGNSKKD
jgi:hypothetical protein